MPSSPVNELPDPGDTAAVEQADDHEAALAGLREQVSQLDDRYRRALADLDNYRKRTAQLTESRIADAAEGLTRDWLDAVDSVERALALEEAGTHAGAFQGLKAVYRQIEAILDRQGVSRIGEAGEPFDPLRHEAVGVQATDSAPDRSVLEVARSGYALKDRLLRPAQVVVARRTDGDS